MIKKGFTLIELLVVIAILSIAGALILTIFTSSLRGSNKSQIVSSIKQNGQSVLETMDKAIRDSDNIVCANSLTPPGPTLVIVKDGVFTRYRFIVPADSANGFIQQDNPLQPAPPASGADIKFFTENVCSDPMQGAKILTDINPASGVSLINPTISTNKLSGFKDSVTIQFTLKPGIGASAAVAGQIDPVTFKTTIQLR